MDYYAFTGIEKQVQAFCCINNYTRTHTEMASLDFFTISKKADHEDPPFLFLQQCIDS